MLFTLTSLVAEEKQKCHRFDSEKKEHSHYIEIPVYIIPDLLEETGVLKYRQSVPLVLHVSWLTSLTIKVITRVHSEMVYTPVTNS